MISQCRCQQLTRCEGTHDLLVVAAEHLVVVSGALAAERAESADCNAN